MRTRPLAVAVLMVVALVAWSAGPAAADEPFVKYYVVTEPGSGPQTLGEIAEAVLDSAQRQTKIFALNVDRLQPDGSRLTDPDHLKPGWVLVLPWDAAGPGVRYGQLPSAAEGGGAPAPQVPAVTACGLMSASGYTPLSWAQLRISPSEAWGRSRGGGVTVAVVDAHLPADTPGLAGRVLPTIPVSTGRGTVDCPGRGPALAAILAAAPRPSSNLIGMAPEATVLPVEVEVDGGYVRESDAARALDAAVAQRAQVVMIPAQVRPGGGELAGALARATGEGTVVVLAAPPRDIPTATPAGQDGLLRVGAVAADDRVAVDYQPGSVDVLAPGINVLTVGEGGTVEATGTDFAVPFVAGLAALIRGADPELPPAEVTLRIAHSADGGVGTPDASRGYGVIDPAVAMGVAPSRARVATPAEDDSSGEVLIGVVVVSAVVIFVLATILVNRTILGPNRRAAGSRR